MGIPLPALDVRPIQQPNPLDEYAKAISIRSMQNQQQLQQQQIVGAGQENQMRAMQMQSQQAIQKAWVDAAGNPDLIPGLALKYNAMPKDVMSLATGLNEMRKSRGQADEVDLKNNQTVLDGVRGPLQSVIGETDPDKRQQAYQGFVDNATTQYKQHPSAAQVGAILQKLPPQAPDDGTLKMWNSSLGVASQINKEATEAKTSQAAMLRAQSTGLPEKTALTSVGVTPGEQPTPQQATAAIAATKTVSPESQEMKDWLAKNPGKDASDFAKWKATLAPQATFNVQMQGLPTQTGSVEDDYAKLRPQDKANVQMVLEGRGTLSPYAMARSPYWSNILGMVNRLDPQFNAQRAELRKSYTVGQQSKEINASNTALQHIGVLGDSVDALNNGNVQALNYLANQAGAQVGATPMTTFRTIVNRVGPELATAYGQGTGGERLNVEKDLSANLSPQQIKGNLGASVTLLRGKLNALENQWEQNRAPSMPSFNDRFITPQAKAALDKWGAKPGAAGGTKQPAAGGIPSFSQWKLQQGNQ